MNHIICDVCGSKFDENAPVCPICGWVQPKEGTPQEPDKVKGGRYSAKNVKRRRKAEAAAAAAAAKKAEQEAKKAKQEEDEEEPEDNRGLLIVIGLLCLAILLVSFYIGLRFFQGRDAYTTKPQSSDSAPRMVPCAGIVLESGVVHLEEAGQTRQLGLTLLPGDTTEEVRYASSDEAVVTVSQEGLLTAVGTGQAKVTVACGEVEKTCTVVCWFQAETTQPVETTVPPETTAPTETTKPTTPSTQPVDKELRLNQSDVSFYTKGETYRFTVRYGGEKLDPDQVTWTSSDDSVVSVHNGKITILARGTVTIKATYAGKTAKCIVRSQISSEPAETTEPTEPAETTKPTEPAETTEPTEPVETTKPTEPAETTKPTEPAETTKPTEPTEPAASGDWKASHSDVTIAPEESFKLRVKDSQGNSARNVSWRASKPDIVILYDNDSNTIVTGLTIGEVTLTATVDGVTVKCIVRVKG